MGRARATVKTQASAYRRNVRLRVRARGGFEAYICLNKPGEEKMFLFKKSADMPTPGQAPAGRPAPIPTAKTHFINGHALKGPYPGLDTAMFGLGCFWGAERKFWELGDKVYVTAVGYAAGHTPNPTYQEVCSGRTGHNEVVLVVFDPKKISYEQLLKTFGRATTRRKACDKATMPARSIAPESMSPRRSRRRRRKPRRRCSRKRFLPNATARSRPKLSMHRNSTLPRTITSNISPRIRAGIADLAARACRARSALR